MLLLHKGAQTFQHNCISTYYMQIESSHKMDDLGDKVYETVSNRVESVIFQVCHTVGTYIYSAMEHRVLIKDNTLSQGRRES